MLKEGQQVYLNSVEKGREETIADEEEGEMPFRSEEPEESSAICLSFSCVMVFLQLGLAICGVAETVLLTKLEEVKYLRFDSYDEPEENLETKGSSTNYVTPPSQVFPNHILYFLYATSGGTIVWMVLATFIVLCCVNEGGKLLKRITGALDLLVAVLSVIAICFAGIRAQELQGIAHTLRDTVCLPHRLMSIIISSSRNLRLEPKGSIYAWKVVKAMKQLLGGGEHMQLCISDHSICVVSREDAGRAAANVQTKLYILGGLWMVNCVGLLIAALLNFLSKSRESYEENDSRNISYTKAKPVIV